MSPLPVVVMILSAPYLPWVATKLNGEMEPHFLRELEKAIKMEPECQAPEFTGNRVGGRATHRYLELMRRALVGATTKNSHMDVREAVNPKVHSGLLINTGWTRMRNLECIMEDIVKHHVPGDFVECGVWQGGVITFMAGFLLVHQQYPARRVWAFDSFMGIPATATGKRSPGKDFDFEPGSKETAAAVAKDAKTGMAYVMNHLQQFDVAEAVKFVPGWFNDTVSVAPVEKIALLRVDGDLYSSTRQVLEGLYPKLSIGGWVVHDDWGVVQSRRAVLDFRADNNITEPLSFHRGPQIYPVARWQKLSS